jgi:hypothetical protein
MLDDATAKNEAAFDVAVRRQARVPPGVGLDYLSTLKLPWETDEDFGSSSTGAPGELDGYKGDRRPQTPQKGGYFPDGGSARDFQPYAGAGGGAGFADDDRPTYEVTMIDASWNDTSLARVTLRKLGTHEGDLVVSVPNHRAREGQGEFERAVAEELGVENPRFLYPKTPYFAYPWGGAFSEMPADNAELSRALGTVAEARAAVEADIDGRLANFSGEEAALAIMLRNRLRSPSPAEEAAVLRRAVAFNREQDRKDEAARKTLSEGERFALLQLTSLGRACGR